MLVRVNELRPIRQLEMRNLRGGWIKGMNRGFFPPFLEAQ